MPLALETAVYSNPLFWAVFVGWVLSVVLHEFAHGLVAYMGGDYTIRERGGLTLNPLQYVDPLNSIVFPLIFLLLGGIPLPGGINYVRKDLLRNRFWDAAVSLAGPAMNFLIFLACLLPMHPRLGWVDIHATASGPAAVLATLGQLQLLAMFINLIPVPPLDGFQAVAAFMDPESKAKLLSPQITNVSLLILFVVLWKTQAVAYMFETGVRLQVKMGFGRSHLQFFIESFLGILYGS
jgi:Zn-dependent protease